MEQQQKNVQKRTIRNINLTSTISMSLVLFLVGLISLLLFVTRDMGNYVKENVNLSIVLDDDIGMQYKKRIEKFLNASPYTKSLEYISKEDALKEHVETLGDDPQAFLGYNPLSASIEVKLSSEYANNDSVMMIEKKLKRFEHIKQVVYQKDMVSVINENVRKMSIVMLGLAVILLVVSIALINNTIRLSLYSNRFSINTMRLVGATHWFIRKPYIISGVFNGMIASVISFVFLAGTVTFVQHEFGLSGMILQLATVFTVVGIVLITGILFTAISSYYAVNKYLKMNSNDMYLI
jgi:cell division transport system permease protein